MVVKVKNPIISPAVNLNPGCPAHSLQVFSICNLYLALSFAGTTLVRMYMKLKLIPNLPPDSAVVIDNASYSNVKENRFPSPSS
jgi:hypothetical protein